MQQVQFGDEIGVSTQFLGKSKITTGRYSYGIKGVRVRQFGEGAELRIGAFCSIAKDVMFILGGEHDLGAMSTYPFGDAYPDIFPSGSAPHSKGDVVVGNDVWIGTGATILSGVTIGNGAVIAANAHVVKDVEPYQVVGGNPAKAIRYRFPPEIIDRLQRLRWWDLPLGDIKAMVPLLSNAPTGEVLDGLLEQHRQGMLVG